MPRQNGLNVRQDRLGEFVKAVTGLTEARVLVGVPDSKGAREEGPINNAALAYIHDNGAPEANIPARPFMKPGVEAVKARIETELQRLGKNALKFGVPLKQVVDQSLARIGLIAVNSIRAKISEGIPPPLADSTIKGRIRRVKGKKRRARIQAALDRGTPASRQGGVEGVFTPLIVTGQLRNAITYVIRRTKTRFGVFPKVTNTVGTRRGG